MHSPSRWLPLLMLLVGCSPPAAPTKHMAPPPVSDPAPRIAPAPSPAPSPAPVSTALPTSPPVLARAVAMGGANICFSDAKGTVNCTGEWPVNFSTPTSSGMRNHHVDMWHRVGELRPTVSLALGTSRGCGVHEDGTVSCWGNTQPMRHEWVGAEPGVLNAVPVAGLRNVHRVAIGQRGSCALHRDRTVSCWGHHFNVDRKGPAPGLAPRPLPLAQVVQLDAALDHACALLEGGQLMCWGEREGTNGPESPQPVAGLPPLTQVSIGWHHACGVDRKRQVWCWGQNRNGQLGIGTSKPQAMPVAVVGLPPAAQVSVSRTGDFSCVLTEGREVFCWGANDNCVLGDSDAPRCERRTMRSTFGDSTAIVCANPQRVTLPVTPNRLLASSTIGCATSEHGQLACWGRPFAGGAPRCRGVRIPLRL